MKEKRLKDIADALGVSVVSVSNALAGRKGVSEKLRKCVVEMADEIGFDRSKYISFSPPKEEEEPQGLTVGVLISDFYVSVGTSFYWEMYQNVVYAAAVKRGFTALEIVQEKVGSPKMAQFLTDGSIDGLLIIGKLKEKYLWNVLKQVEVPVVFLDFGMPESHRSAVFSSNYMGMYRVTGRLYDMGHREIGFLGTMKYSDNVAERYLGFLRFMIEHGLPVVPEWVVADRGGETEEPEVRLPKRMPTAFACSSDYAAGLLHDELKKRNIRIPEDLSLASYDDYLYGHELTGKLTTYHVDMERMAFRAVEQLYREIAHPEEAGKCFYIDGNVIERESILWKR